MTRRALALTVLLALAGVGTAAAQQAERDGFVDPDTTLPYHQAAVRFYKEHDAWKPDLDQIQQKLLSLNP